VTKIKVIFACASILLLSSCGYFKKDWNGNAERVQPHHPHHQNYAGNHHHEDEKVADSVFFEFDSSAITPEGQEVLGKQAVFMNQNPSLEFIVEGHCDERGTREYNLALGERRANSAKQYLVSLGINPNRLTTVSFGKERPAVSGSGEWAWSQNRRAVTIPK
jgi:peptidoglycan-associated lipoprotein